MIRIRRMEHRIRNDSLALILGFRIAVFDAAGTKEGIRNRKNQRKCFKIYGWKEKCFLIYLKNGAGIISAFRGFPARMFPVRN